MYTLLILFFMISIVVSFLCSLWESVLLSITPSYAHLKRRDGGALGKRLHAFKTDIDRPLAAILTLNTIAHTVGAIGVGAQATNIWAEANPLITAVLIPASMTLAILILSEIIPKTMGAIHWQGLAPFTVASLVIIDKVLSPLVWLCRQITNMLKRDRSHSVFTHTEFLAMGEIGVVEGQVDTKQLEIIENLLHLHTIPVKEVMTPRVVVNAAPEEMTLRHFFNENKRLPFSRIPLYKGDSKENVSGYFLKQTLLSRLLEGRGNDSLATLKREIIIVHEAYPIRDLFNKMLRKHEQFALAVDEFGGMAGIATLEDVIEALLGTEIIDESDRVEDMRDEAQKKTARHARKHGWIYDSEEEK
jgi:CBS domain containing-hemolysin-like protein